VVSRAAAGKSPASNNSSPIRSPANLVSKVDRAVSNRTASLLNGEVSFWAPATGPLFCELKRRNRHHLRTTSKATKTITIVLAMRSMLFMGPLLAIQNAHYVI
jgi:hypothetical protein